MYDVLGFSHFHGRSWRWVAAGRKQWDKACRENGLEGHLEFSTQVGKGKAEQDTTGVLPYNAISMWGCLLLLLRWSSHDERMGGLRDDDHRAAAGLLLQAFIGAFVANNPRLEVEVDLAPSWTNLWPRPASFRNRTEILLVDGIADISGWEKCADEQGPRSFAAESASLLQVGLGADRGVLAMMRALSSHKRLAGIFSQVLWAIGMAMHDAFIRGMQGGALKGAHVKTVDIAELFQTPNKLSETLVRYVSACKSKLATPRAVCMCTDKAAVVGFSMQCSVLTVPSGVAVVAPPQALEFLAPITQSSSAHRHLEHPPDLRRTWRADFVGS